MCRLRELSFLELAVRCAFELTCPAVTKLLLKWKMIQLVACNNPFMAGRFKTYFMAQEDASQRSAALVSRPRLLLDASTLAPELFANTEFDDPAFLHASFAYNNQPPQPHVFPSKPPRPALPSFSTPGWDDLPPQRVPRPPRLARPPLLAHPTNSPALPSLGGAHPTPPPTSTCGDGLQHCGLLQHDADRGKQHCGCKQHRSATFSLPCPFSLHSLKSLWTSRVS